MSQSREVDEAVGTAPEDAEIEQLKGELTQPSEREVKAQRLQVLEAERARKRIAQLTSVAVQRLVGIQRADGSLADQEDQDDDRVLKTAKAHAEAEMTPQRCTIPKIAPTMISR